MTENPYHSVQVNINIMSFAVLAKKIVAKSTMFTFANGILYYVGFKHTPKDNAGTS